MSSAARGIFFRLADFSRCIAWFVSIIGLVVLIGWAAGTDVLKQVLHSPVSMNPLTALTFILAATALWLFNRGSSGDRTSAGTAKAGRIIGLVVLALGASKLLGYAFGWDVGIDRILFAGKLESRAFPSRMAPNTAFCFSLVGLAFLFFDSRTRRVERPAELMAGVVGLISLLALIGYAYEVRVFHGASSYIPMALHSAITFIVLSVGIVCARPRAGLMTVLISNSSGGRMIRRLLPGTGLVLIGVGWLRLEGERRGLYEGELGVTIYTVVTLAIFALLICTSAKSLHRADMEHRRVEAERERFFTLSRDLLCTAGFDGYLKRLNPAWEKTLGFTTAELTGKPFLDFIHPDDRMETSQAVETVSQGKELISFENRYLCKDGSYRWIQWSANPWLEEHFIYAAGRDVTERKQSERQIAEMNEDLARRAVELNFANKELEAFSYSVSHDLRAPLRHTAGFVKLLEKQAGTSLDPKGQRFLKIISDSTAEMGRLIDDLLSFSRMGRAEINATRLDLARLIRDTILSFEQEIAGRDVIWKIGDLPEVEADPALLRMAITNLLSNALKYSRPRERTEIEIGLQSETDQEDVFFVRDNGVGFDMRYAHKLFGVFQRLHEADEFEGTGIGLANVQRIISRHRGRIWAEGAVDQGATFYFSLPKSRKTAS